MGLRNFKSSFKNRYFWQKCCLGIQDVVLCLGTPKLLFRQFKSCCFEFRHPEPILLSLSNQKLLFCVQTPQSCCFEVRHPKAVVQAPLRCCFVFRHSKAFIQAPTLLFRNIQICFLVFRHPKAVVKASQNCCLGTLQAGPAPASACSTL